MQFSKKNIFKRHHCWTTIAMIIIPQSMAYATLANLEPIYGLYASFIPVAIAAFLGHLGI